MPFSINLSGIPYPQVKKSLTVGNFHDYTIKKGLNACFNKGLLTENINSCTAGVLNAGKRNFMFHAAPEMQDLTTVKKELLKQIDKLRESCEDIKGFICGGWALNTKDRETVRSFDLYNTIADTLDELGVKFTMLCGKEKGSPMDNMYAVNQGVTVWNNSFKELLPDIKNKADMQDVLEKQYQFVELSPEIDITASAPKLKSLAG